MVSETDSFTKIAFKLLEATIGVDIIAEKVVPEFPLAGLIFAISIGVIVVSMALVSRKHQFFFR